MLERYSDILVLGTDIPGLVTAAFLAKRGLSVQVVDLNPLQGEPESDPICLTNLNSKLLRSILGRLNVPELTIQHFLGQNSTLQLLFNRHRLDIDHNPLLFFEELEREFPHSYADIKSFYESQAKSRHLVDINDLYQQLVPSGFRAAYRFRKFANQQQLNTMSDEWTKVDQLGDVVASFFKAQLLLAYQVVLDQPFAYQVAEVFNPSDGEIFHVAAGVRPLKKLLIDRIQNHEGAVRNGVALKQLLYRKGVLEGAEFNDPHGVVLAKYVIWNDQLSHLEPVLPKSWRLRSLKKASRLRHPKWYWGTFKFAIESIHLPDLLQNNALYIDDPKQPLSGANFLYLQVHRDASQPQATVCVNVLVEPEQLHAGNDQLVLLASQIKQHVLTLMPFADKKLQCIYPVEHAAVQTDTLFPLGEDEFARFRAEAELHPVYHEHVKSFIDLFRVDYKTPLPNLFMSSTDVFWGLGAESKLVLGLKITDAIWQEVEKVKKRAMKSERRIA